MAHFRLNDSGARRSFESGAVRDRDGTKPRIDLICPFFLERLGELMRVGAEKYGDRNWEKGIPSKEYLASACRHLVKYMQDQRDEDHLSQAAFNIMGLIRNEETGFDTKHPVTGSDVRSPDEGPRHEEVEDPVEHEGRDLVRQVRDAGVLQCQA